MFSPRRLPTTGYSRSTFHRWTTTLHLTRSKALGMLTFSVPKSAWVLLYTRRSQCFTCAKFARNPLWKLVCMLEELQRCLLLFGWRIYRLISKFWSLRTNLERVSHRISFVSTPIYSGKYRIPLWSPTLTYIFSQFQVVFQRNSSCKDSFLKLQPSAWTRWTWS